MGIALLFEGVVINTSRAFQESPYSAVGSAVLGAHFIVNLL